MKLTSQRLRDFAIYLAAGLILVAGITFSAIYTAQKALDPYGVTRWIGPGLETALVFGFVLYWYRKFLRTASLWITLALLFCGHCIALWLIAVSSGPVPLVYWWVAAVVEQLAITWLVDQVIHRRPISKA